MLPKRTREIALRTRASAIHPIGVLTTNLTRIALRTILGQVRSNQVLTLCGMRELTLFPVSSGSKLTAALLGCAGFGNPEGT